MYLEVITRLKMGQVILKGHIMFALFLTYSFFSLYRLPHSI